jgi:hypothetical protein
VGWTRRRGQQIRANDAHRTGPRRQVIGALIDTAAESAKEGVNKASEKAGKLAGAGLVFATTGAFEATGHHPPALVAVGAAYLGAKVGGVVGKGLTAGIDKITTRAKSGSPITDVLGTYIEVLQTLQAMGEAAEAAIDGLNGVRDRYQRLHHGSQSTLMKTAVQRCEQARRAARDGRKFLTDAQDNLGDALVTAATFGS